MKVQLDNKIYSFERTMHVRELIKTLSLNPETHLVSVNNELVTADHLVLTGDIVKIIRVVSGG